MKPSLRYARRLVLLCVSFGLACSARDAQKAPKAPPSPAAQEEAIQWKNLPVGAIGYDFQWRQRVTARWHGGERTFDAVLSKDDGTLQLLGLGPMGKVGFVLRLRDGAPVALEHHPSLTFAFDPRYVLLDVQRAFYPWIPGNPPSGDGRRSAAFNGESIVEDWKNGALLERQFRSLSDPADPGVHVRYSKRAPNADVAERTVLENARLGYRLEIQTLSQVRLSP